MSNSMTNKFKQNIKLLIESGKIDEAKPLLEEYGKIEKNDLEFFSIASVIYLMEGNSEKAKKIIQEGLSRDSSNFDLLYNFAYLHHVNGDISLAFEYYTQAYNNATNDEEAENASVELAKLRSEVKNKKAMEKLAVSHEKKKIVFFSKGDDKFLLEVISNLSSEYETKKITITKNEEFQLIDKWMKWADICWFEWCDELVIYGSSQSIAKRKKIICRLHSYEAFTRFPDQVNWDTVDKVIFISESIRRELLPELKLEIDKTCIIANGLNASLWSYKKRKPGLKIAYVGYINYKKGPMLLIQVISALYNENNDFQFHIAGQFQDKRDLLYFRQMIKELGLERNFHFEGWQKDLNTWLEDKDYILCTSVLESQNMSVMQAMAKGIKPIVHNFVGAKEIYSKNYVWNTVDEAVKMVTESQYNSEEYRGFIENNYSLKKQMVKIENLLKEETKYRYFSKGILPFALEEKINLDLASSIIDQLEIENITKIGFTYTESMIVITQYYVYKIAFTKKSINMLLKEMKKYEMIKQNIGLCELVLSDIEIIEKEEFIATKAKKMSSIKDYKDAIYILDILRRNCIGIKRLEGVFKENIFKTLGSLVKFVDKKKIEKVKNKIEKAIEKNEFHIGPVHGDLHSRNILNYNEKIKIIDLDRFDMNGIQELDVIHLIVDHMQKERGINWFNQVLELLYGKDDRILNFDILLDRFVSKEKFNDLLLIYSVKRIEEELNNYFYDPDSSKLNKIWLRQLDDYIDLLTKQSVLK